MVIVACHGTIHGIKLIEIKMTELEKLLKSDKGMRAKFAKHEAKSAIKRALRIACPDCCLDDVCLKAMLHCKTIQTLAVIVCNLEQKDGK